VKLSDIKQVPVIEKTDTAKVQTMDVRIALAKDGVTYQLFDQEGLLVAESNHPRQLLKLVEAKLSAEQIIHDYPLKDMFTFEAEVAAQVEPLDMPVEKKP
jgi:hypothetical protein